MLTLLVYFGLLTDVVLSGCGAEDSTLNILKTCGSPYKITMTYDRYERELYMYIPTIFCDETEFTKYVNERLNNKNNPFDSKIHQMTIPILLAIHCLGCTANQELSKWKSYAEDHTFILIAPEGISRSWNADQCCDPAVEDSIDDLGFIQTIINGAQTSFSKIFPFATVRNKNYDGYVWVTGFSNGGFMSDKIAWISTINQFSKIVAAAPMSGYIYDKSKYINKNNKDKHNKVAIYFHHSKSDRMVDPNGCCMDSHNCCCSIADKSINCLSIYNEYSNWLQWNGCNKNIQFDNIKVNKIVDGGSRTHGHIDVSCAYATPEEHGCDVYTHLCMYENIRHAEWASYAPQIDDVIIFFLKSLCLQQNGKFNQVMLKCECGENSKFAGFNCISPKSALGLADKNVDVVTAENHDEIIASSMNDQTVKKDDIVGEKKDLNEHVMDSMNEKTVMDNVDNSKQQWKNVVRNGKLRQIKHMKNKDLSVLGNAGNKYGDKTFEFDAVNNEDKMNKMPNTSIVLICTMLFTSIGLFIMYKKKQSGYAYSKVKLHDDENESINNSLINHH
eukprot:276248_1